MLLNKQLIFGTYDNDAYFGLHHHDELDFYSAIFIRVYYHVSRQASIYALIFRYFMLRLDIYIFNINTETIILSLLNEPKWFQNQLLTVLTI